jgi:hypothetical protein
MEARQTLRGSAFPKALMIVLVLCAAVLLAVGASYIGKGVTGSGSSVTTNVHPAAGTVLRQDNPVQGSQLIDRAAKASPSAPFRSKKNFDQMPGFRD